MKKILVVDDSKCFRKYLATILESILNKEWQVMQAENGEEALIMLTSDVKFVLTDLIMPIMDGLDLVDILINKKHFDIHSILVLSSAKDEVLTIALKHLGLNVEKDFYDKEKASFVKEFRGILKQRIIESGVNIEEFTKTS